MTDGLKCDEDPDSFRLITCVKHLDIIECRGIEFIVYPVTPATTVLRDERDLSLALHLLSNNCKSACEDGFVQVRKG